MTRQRAFIISTAAAVLLALWLYWPTLSLPLIYDTLLHIRITGTLDWRSVWLPTEAFGFYRPLTFAPMLLIEQLFGDYPRWLLHGLNVGQHALNGALLAWLCARLWGGWRRPFTAALLFVTFPFSYQAVAVYGHNVHPTTTGLLLLGLHAYLTAVKGKRPFPWALTGLLFLLGLLSHESAILFGPLAALVHWQQDPPRPPWRRLWPAHAPWLIFSLLGGAYLIAYQFLPITRAPQAAALSAGSVGLKLLYLLQAVTHPLVWPLQRLSGWNGGVIVGLATAVTSLWLLWAVRKWELRWPLLLALGWSGLAYVLIAVPLTTNYLLHGPRLLYLGAVGVALLWATLLERVWLALRPPLAAWAWGAALLALLLPAALFVRGRMAAYQMLTGPVDDVATTMQDLPPAAGVVLLNLPQWLDAPQNSYPIGVEFVSMLGDYLFVEELIWHNLPGRRPATAVTVPELQAQTPYSVGLHGQTSPDAIPWDAAAQQHVFLTEYSDTGLQTRYLGWTVRSPAAPADPLADFFRYQLLDAAANTCNGFTTVMLTWRAGAALPTPTTSIFVQALDGAGQVAAQADGPPLALRPDWTPHTETAQLVDRRLLATGDGMPAAVLVGVYDFMNGVRETAVDAAGNPLPDNALRLPVTAVCP